MMKKVCLFFAKKTLAWLSFLAVAGMLLPAWAGDSPPRQPAVAGRFYPGDAKTLERDVRLYLEKAKKNPVPGEVKALVCPHAGYEYSAVVAAASYSKIPRGARRVIILGAAHSMRYRGCSIPDASAYITPLGKVPIAKEAQVLLSQPGFSSINEAHAREHSIEVQLPFLQVVLEDFEFIPILMGSGVDPGDLAEKLMPLVNRGYFVIASTDLSHYYEYEKAQRLDKICCQAIPNLDYQDMKRCEACGWVPVMTLMHIAEKKKWTGTLLDYRNSGDTAGQKDKVVGYGAIAFSESKGERHMPSQKASEQDQRDLLVLARSVIASRLTDAAIQRPADPSALLREKRGCFVTLHKHGQLRGCIGTIEPVQTLLEGVESNAYNAAFRDPRFAPLTASELDQVEIEVSILTVPRELPFIDGADLKAKLKPGVHGVILSRGARRSTFLPQVWEQLPQPETFLIQLCKKAGLPPNSWQDPQTKVEVYEAEYFSE